VPHAAFETFTWTQERSLKEGRPRASAQDCSIAT
jgi:hypothetical protein